MSSADETNGSFPRDRLDGRLAVVTGAGAADGIGYATARRLAAAGARVLLAATSARVHDRAEELRALGADATAVVGDLTDDADTAALLEAAAGASILVNNAGMTSVVTGGEVGSLDATTPEIWQASLARNLTSAYAVTRGLLPGMREQGWGRIVMVSSVTGPVVAYPGDAAYAAAKAGMTGLMRAIAVEEGPHGITCNAVAPGWIDTGSATDEERAMGRATPVGRPGTPDEVAALIRFCCTPEAGYVTGQVLVVDGGNVVQDDKRRPIDP
jgi:3-oxoacyl-[acyl-carrier protein] reductase